MVLKRIWPTGNWKRYENKFRNVLIYPIRFIAPGESALRCDRKESADIFTACFDSADDSFPALARVTLQILPHMCLKNSCFSLATCRRLYATLFSAWQIFLHNYDLWCFDKYEVWLYVSELEIVAQILNFDCSLLCLLSVVGKHHNKHFNASLVIV